MKLKTKSYFRILIVALIISILVLVVNIIDSYCYAHHNNTWWFFILRIIDGITLGWFISKGVLSEVTKWFYNDPTKNV